MTVTSSGMTSAMQGLHEALESARRPGVSDTAWRSAVRRQMDAVRDALAAETGEGGESWLAAREAGLLHERDALLARLNERSPQILDELDEEQVRSDLERLLVDISHHQQRLHDLAYDEVELELGGSD